MERGKWTTKNGKTLSIKDMDIPHIKNCIIFLERNMPEEEENVMICGDHWSLGCVTFRGAKWYRKKIREFQKELERRNK